MVSKTARKNVVSHGGKFRSGQKVPVNMGKLQRSKPGVAQRPRRFSLLYSSDSSLSDVSDLGDNRSRNETSPTKRKTGKVRSISNNAAGKRSKLIQNDAGDSSDGQAVVSSSEEDSDEEDDDDDDDSSDDDGSDSDGSDSDTSSDDENIDFVKLTAQRKKRAMKALSALKKNKSPTKSPTKTAVNGQRRKSSHVRDVKPQLKEKPEADSDSASNEVALAFNFRKDDDGIRFGDASEHSEEDIGEEVKDSDEPAPELPFDDTLNQLHVPEFSVSEESEYDIDQDAYFNVIEDESMGEMDTGLETGEDEVPILHEEEKNMMAELKNADDLSFDGSIHEEGSDPAERLRSPFVEGKAEVVEDEDSDDDDEIMTVFDMPFYEDPKFASLYYCEDGDEPRLSLSTSLPLLVSGEKLKRMKKREAMKLERQERIQRRKLLKEKRNAKGVKATQVDGDEYIFGVFFQSEEENGEEAKRRNPTLRGNLDLESPLRRLGSAAASDVSSDDEYDNILLDIAHMPSDDESKENGHESPKVKQSDHNASSSMSDSSAIDVDEESDVVDDDKSDDDDLSDTNVFIDIDDLDPDSFYFQESDEEDVSSYSEIMTDDTDVSHGENSKEEPVETVKYVDDESTDEDDNLPPPNSRNKVIGSKAKEIVSANIVGLKPPKLGTWETDSKPFTIIDGLSTKSLYPLIQEHQQLIEQQQRAHSQSPDLRSAHELSSTNGDELTLNELLNMSELEDEDEDHSTPSFLEAVSNWYEKPKVPLSAFRNKGVNEHEDDEYMLPVNSTRKAPIGYIGSERTRRKIDRMKELQRKKTEKRRRTKKKKKMLKLKRRQERLEKEKSKQIDKTPEVADTNLTLGTPDFSQQTDHFTPESTDRMARSRKGSVKSVGLEEIHEILGKDNSDLLDGGDPNCALIDEENDIDLADADILASLTAPIQLDNIGGAPSWRRRQSMVEAAAENLRFTKNGLFSETALADIEDIIGTGGTSGAFEFSASLQ